MEVESVKSGYHSVQLLTLEGECAAELWIGVNFEHSGTGVLGFRRSYDFLGMHGSIQSEKIVMSNDSKMRFYRVVVEPGLSAAE